MNKSAQEAATFNDKREVHFERLIARGQNPIRIQK
jgi:acyl-[acyl-carrier-protein] desaturase